MDRRAARSASSAGAAAGLLVVNYLNARSPAAKVDAEAAEGEASGALLVALPVSLSVFVSDPASDAADTLHDASLFSYALADTSLEAAFTREVDSRATPSWRPHERAALLMSESLGELETALDAIADDVSSIWN